MILRFFLQAGKAKTRMLLLYVKHGHLAAIHVLKRGIRKNVLTGLYMVYDVTKQIQ
jgi:hypothetical protein